MVDPSVLSSARISVARRLQLPAAVAVCTATALLWLAQAPAASLNAQRFLLAQTSSWPPPVHTAVHVLSEGGVVVLAALLLTAARSGPRGRTRNIPGVAAGAAGTLLAYCLSETLKMAVDQPRPCHLAAVKSLIACPPTGDWAFPSNHATVAAGLAVAVVMVIPRLGAVALLLAALVTLSRVALGVHYPHDVIAGVLIGAVTVAMVHLNFTPWFGRSRSHP
jgi:membrane-associated phospholipid phosphatase